MRTPRQRCHSRYSSLMDAMLLPLPILLPLLLSDSSDRPPVLRLYRRHMRAARAAEAARLAIRRCSGSCVSFNVTGADVP